VKSIGEYRERLDTWIDRARLRHVLLAFAVTLGILLTTGYALATHTVWISKSGRGLRYHEATCHSLKRSRVVIPINLSKARELGLTPCQLCQKDIQ
jgi:hypothetical protein